MAASHIVTCPACGALDRYGLTTEATPRLWARAVAVARGDDPGAIILTPNRLFDGTVARRPSQALAHLRHCTELAPESCEAWRRFGNTLERFGEQDEAVLGDRSKHGQLCTTSGRAFFKKGGARMRWESPACWAWARAPRPKK